MRWLNSLLLVAALLAGYSLTIALDKMTPRAPLSAETPQAVPEFSFIDIEGKNHAIADFHGKVVILNFWATWCPPCVAEFPALLKIAAQNPDIILVALSSDRTDDDIHKFLQQRPVPADNVVIARDSEDITMKLFGISQFPETLVIDSKGQRREKLVGGEWDPDMLQKIIDSLSR